MDDLELRHLSDAQSERYDLDLVHELWWEEIATEIARWLPPNLRLLELGGGSGRFADRVLDRFTDATATVLDSSPVLLRRNRPHPRKRVVEGSIEQLPGAILAETYDLVTLHWVLHHLVAGRYSASRRAQSTALKQASALLAPVGMISVFENAFDGVVLDSLPSRLIHMASSLRVTGPLFRRLGADPAGVGVCFLSDRAWCTTFERCGLTLVSRRRYQGSLEFPRRWHGWLIPARLAVCHYWLRPGGRPPAPGPLDDGSHTPL